MTREGNKTPVLAVTVDINERIHIAWGTPTTSGDSFDDIDAQMNRRVTDLRGWIVVEGVSDARVSGDQKWVTQVYGKGGNAIATNASVFRVLKERNIVRLLAPTYFIRGREKGRIAVRKDGVEVPLLAVLGEFLSIPDPTWKTANCWREDITNIVSKETQPVGGSLAYSRRYYKKTAEKRRALAKKYAKQTASKSTFDELISLLPKAPGGGGPLPSE